MTGRSNNYDQFPTKEHPDQLPYPSYFKPMNWPEMEINGLAMKQFEVSEGGIENLRAIRDGMPYRVVPPGKYTKLVDKEQKVLWMSDTPAEAWEHQELFAAEGRIIIAGLGMGFALQALIDKANDCGEAYEITVVENDPRVIEMVGDRFTKQGVEVVHADIFNYLDFQKPGTIDYIWFDIWPTISADNLKEMGMLMAEAKRLKADCGCWGLRWIAKRCMDGYECEDDFSSHIGTMPEPYLLSVERKLLWKCGTIFAYCNNTFQDILGGKHEY